MLEFSTFSPTFPHYLDTMICQFDVKKVFFSSKINNCSLLSWRDGREMLKAQALFHEVSNYWEHW